MGQPQRDRGGTAAAWLDALFANIVEEDGREEKALDLESFLAFLERGSCLHSPSPQPPLSSSSPSSLYPLPVLTPPLGRKPLSRALSTSIASTLTLIPSSCSSTLSTTLSSLPPYPRWQKREFTHHIHVVEYMTIDKDGRMESLLEKEVTGKEVLHVEWEGESNRGKEEGRKGGGGEEGGWGRGGTAHRERIEYSFREIMDGGVVVEEECGREEYVHLARRRESGTHEVGLEGEEEGEEEEEEWERMESSLPARYFNTEEGKGGRGEDEWKRRRGGDEGGGGEERPEEQQEGGREGGEEGGLRQGESVRRPSPPPGVESYRPQTIVTEGGFRMKLVHKQGHQWWKTEREEEEGEREGEEGASWGGQLGREIRKQSKGKS